MRRILDARYKKADLNKVMTKQCNLHETYVDDVDPWMEILVESSFALHFTYHWKKGKIPGQLVFGQYMIL